MPWLPVGLVSYSGPTVCPLCLWLFREVLLLAMPGDPNEFKVLDGHPPPLLPQLCFSEIEPPPYLAESRLLYLALTLAQGSLEAGHSALPWSSQAVTVPW